MEKQLKDYLPFYLGCEIELTSPSGKVKRRKVSLSSVYLLYGDIKSGFYDKIKLCLRPLSSMTEDESYEWGTIDHPITGTSDLMRHEAEKTKYLLDKHFDLFGLIEAGLAIDQTTQPK